MSEEQTDERPRRTWSPARRAAAARRRSGETDGQRPDAELIAEEVVGEAVANITTLAGFIMPIAPYTGITIAGVPGEREGEWIVRSRAEMAGSVLLEHAKRNHRVLAAVARFNLMFKNVEIIEVAGAVIASAAVDAKLVEPDAIVKLPGGIEAPILYPAIGDTIQYIALQQQTEVVAHPTEKLTREESLAAGGRGQEEMTTEQRAEARRIRRNLEQRDKELEAERGRVVTGLAQGVPLEPTARREGQVVVEGDVTKT